MEREKKRKGNVCKRKEMEIDRLIHRERKKERER